MERDFSAVSTPELVDAITTLAGHLNAAHARFLALIAELDRRKGWAEWGVKSCAHWLNWKCGIEPWCGAGESPCRARLGDVAARPRAMAEGRLSYAKVRAMTRVATPANESYLLNIALCGTASHVESVVRGYRRALDAEELSREAIQQRYQSLLYYTEADGSMVIRGRLPAEIGALFVRALEAAEDSLPIQKTFRGNVFGRDRHRLRNRRVEALATLAESFLATGPRDLSGGDRNQIVVHVDAETCKKAMPASASLNRGHRSPRRPPGACPATASVVRILEDSQGEPLDVGRKTRTIPPAIRRALNARDKGCRFPGCTFRRYVDGHHVQHWAHGGETRLSNLVTLCRFHHRLVHEGQVDDPDAGRRGVPIRETGRRDIRESSALTDELG